MKAYLITLLLFGLSLSIAIGQVPTVCIKAIGIQGNKKSKRLAILSYLNFELGDRIQLQDLMSRFKENERLLMNSRLFTKVSINIGKWDAEMLTIKIEVEENWYFFPLPVVELADRNFNIWWRDFNCDPRRVNLGLWTHWRNVTGYNDRMLLIAQIGYIRKFEIDYDFPPLSQKRRWGFGFNALYSDNKESAYNIENNILQFYSRFDSKIRQYSRLRLSLKASFRQSLFDKHYLEIYYKDLNISDSLSLLNPDFFLDNRKRQRSILLDYEFRRDRRNIISYPTKGHYIQLNLLKRGLGIFKDINQLWLSCRGEFYHKIRNRWSTALIAEGRYSAIRQKQPFWQQEALGYQDSYIRGYQYYVINGQDYVFIRSDINFKLLDHSVSLFKNPKPPLSRKIPFKIHLRYHLDYGHVWDRFYQYQGELVNQQLLGTGIGLDLALLDYNFVTQIEYSFNKVGENDVYLRIKIDF